MRALTLGFYLCHSKRVHPHNLELTVKAVLTRGELKARQDYTHLLSVTLILGLEGTQKELRFKPSQYSGPLSQCVAPRANGCLAQECYMVNYLSTLWTSPWGAC